MATAATAEDMVAAIRTWKDAALASATASESYRLQWSAAYIAAKDEKTDTARKAVADKVTTAARSERDRLEIVRDAAYHMVIFLRGAA